MRVAHSDLGLHGYAQCPPRLLLRLLREVRPLLRDDDRLDEPLLTRPLEDRLDDPRLTRPLDFEDERLGARLVRALLPEDERLDERTVPEDDRDDDRPER